MSTITAFEAKTRFGELLDRASRGEEIVITRYDKPVARLIPEGDVTQRQIAGAVDALKSLRAEIAGRKKFRKLSAREIKAAINEGRP
jgi:prevent-host-death family protein